VSPSQSLPSLYSCAGALCFPPSQASTCVCVGGGGAARAHTTSIVAWCKRRFKPLSHSTYTRVAKELLHEKTFKTHVHHAGSRDPDSVFARTRFMQAMQWSIQLRGDAALAKAFHVKPFNLHQVLWVRGFSLAPQPQPSTCYARPRCLLVPCLHEL
jgi:hypothetical protein